MSFSWEMNVPYTLDQVRLGSTQWDIRPAALAATAHRPRHAACNRQRHAFPCLCPPCR
jgi:hypothetical protein